MLVGDKEITYGCDKCDYDSTNCKNSTKHKQLKHGNNYLRCENCDYESARLENLLRHKQVQHNGLVMLNCPDYSFTAHWQSIMNSHKREKYRKEVLLNCDKCDYNTSNKISFMNHRDQNQEGD